MTTVRNGSLETKTTGMKSINREDYLLQKSVSEGNTSSLYVLNMWEILGPLSHDPHQGPRPWTCTAELLVHLWTLEKHARLGPLTTNAIQWLIGQYRRTMWVAVICMCSPYTFNMITLGLSSRPPPRDQASYPLCFIITHCHNNSAVTTIVIFLFADVFCFNLSYFIFRYQSLTNCSSQK